MLNIREAFIKYLVKTLGLTVKEAEAKVPEEADSDFTEVLAGLENVHKAKVNLQKEEDYDSGHKKGTGEALAKFEDEVRSKYDIKSKKKGTELLDEVITAKLPDPAKPESISEDVVKKHPAFLARERELSDALQEAKSETETKVNEVLQGIAQKETLQKVAGLGVSAFRGLNPVLPADATKAERQEARLTREIEASGLKFEFQEGNPEPLVLEADGKKRKQDGHGNPIRFNDLIKGFAEDLGFEFKVASERSSAGGAGGNQTPAPVPGAKFTGKAPATIGEYQAIISDSSLSFDQRAEVQDTYEKQFFPSS